MYAMENESFEKAAGLIQSGNYAESFKMLSELKTTHSDDPEYYALIINYYFSKSMSDVIVLRSGKPTQDECLLIYDSTNSKPIGVIEENTIYNLDTLDVGIKEFEKGLTKFKNRLDLHFGIIHVALLSEQYSLMQNKLLHLIQISKEIDNNWLWCFNEKYSNNNEEDFLDLVQANIHQLFQKATPKTDSIITSVSKSLIKNYPNCIYGYNNIGAISFYQGNLDEAKRNFEVAYKLDKKDFMVLSNLAKISSEQGLKNDALKYYEIIANIADEKTSNWAKAQIKLLQKKQE